MRNIQITDHHELSKYKEIQFILDSAEISVYASLSRKESRWGWFHFRTDYPKKDDENWLKHVVLEKGEKSGEVQTSLVPIQNGGV